eukprot:TRINITY_DN26373_c0_g1_i1.p1 TRINITY_DN26373_c0_g1~~TRINITY_DN26373_c0_g1_i1.p1  ORF type:complete len:293 (+),score=51.98 TRINITY_DN26373_c0_g1_i1:193-1071(+)
MCIRDSARTDLSTWIREKPRKGNKGSFAGVLSMIENAERMKTDLDLLNVGALLESELKLDPVHAHGFLATAVEFKIFGTTEDGYSPALPVQLEFPIPSAPCESPTLRTLLRGLLDGGSVLSALRGSGWVLEQIWLDVECWYEDHICEQTGYVSKGSVEFPEPSGLNVNMMPFVIGNKTSLPPWLQQYWPLIQQCLHAQHTPLYGLKSQIWYLTVHESEVAAGESQRRGGLHCESPGDAMGLGDWGPPGLGYRGGWGLSLIHISEPTRLLSISYAVFCLKKKKKIITIDFITL